jgi:hypothetical protein
VTYENNYGFFLSGAGAAAGGEGAEVSIDFLTSITFVLIVASLV